MDGRPNGGASMNQREESRDGTTGRTFTFGRVVALVVIAMLVFGLAYVRFVSGATSVSVPAGARAGDLIIEPCTHATENGSYDADCGTLVVPENRADPRSRLIALPVTRIHGTSDVPGEPVFLLWGGPGLSNMGWPQASRLAEDRDVVLVGYRGVDGSSVLDCPEVVSALKHSSDLLASASADAFSDGLASCAERLRGEEVDLAGYTVAQRAEDLEAARTALGYDRIDLLSESAGTRTAMIYAWRYPENVHRSVMIAVNPPGHFMWDPRTTDEQIEGYADLCSQDETCRTRTDDLAEAMRRTAAHIPDRWLFLPIKEGNVRAGTFFGLMESTSAAGVLSAPMTLDAWLSASDGDPSGLWFESLLADLFFPESFVWGDEAAMGMQDAEFVDDYYADGGDPGSILRNAGTDFVWGRGGMTTAWPANPARDVYTEVETSDVETLLVGGTLDLAVPPAAATEELLPHLPNGHQVVLPGFGHTGSFWAEQQEAGTRLINTFLESGEVDDSLYRSQPIDFTPGVTYTALAKGFVVTMVGFAVVAMLSLLWMARRVRNRGGFGPKVGAALRSILPVVLGLGGWFLGALIVLAAGLTVPLDNQLLAVLGVGVPIGLGIYWAWVHRDWSRRTKVTGFIAAIGGALVGAWLGFNVTTGLPALFTAIVGAAIVPNLILIVLDISKDRSSRYPVPSFSVDPGLERVHA